MNLVDRPFYSTKPEWKDVAPLEQYENINPLAPILYTDECLSLYLVPSLALP